MLVSKSAKYDKWVLTNPSNPKAYAWRDNWGLVETEAGMWRLYFIVRNHMREVGRFEGELEEKENAPFTWANGEIKKHNVKQSRTWEERELGNRKPGEEGQNGGKLLPKQTISPDQARRNDAKARAKAAL